MLQPSCKPETEIPDSPELPKETSFPLCCFQKLHEAQTDGAFKKATREATSTA